MKKLYYILIIFLTLLGIIPVRHSYAQSVLNPNDTIVNYDPNNPPAYPTQAGMFKWVRTPKFSWSVPNYKCYYISAGYHSGMAFRLLYPRTYQTDPPGTTYPMLVFFHGEGEISPYTDPNKAPNYDNELQLANCAQAIMDSCLKANPSFDGFIMFPQATSMYWNNYFPAITQVIDYMTANNNLDPNRIIFSGLSMGGGATWQFLKSFPGYAAGATPMCNANMGMATIGTIDSLQDIPIWYTQGGLDTDPYPATATSFVNYLTSNGLSVRYTLYPNLGHGVWNQHYLEPDAFTWMAQQNRTNPHVYSNRSLFCIGDTIRDTLGVVQGFPGYQWAKNGVVIPAATSNTIIVTDTGTYSARILMNNGQWSYWSPSPAHITYRTVTKAPAIQVAGLMSRVIPAPDGNTSVILTEPAGYATYQWTDGAGKVLANSRTYTASGPGYYRAVVTVNGGCSSVPSDSFYVAANNGPNPPSPASDLSGYALSQTSIQLNWSRDLHPANPETAFEIYRATLPGGPFALAGIVPAGATGFTDQSLIPGKMYYYAVRSIDSTAAASLSAVDSIATFIDKQAPTAPGNLRLIGADSSTLTVNWSAATDNVGVTNYYIYVNGLRRYSTSGTNTQFTLTNLIHDSSYVITVKAVDGAGNISAPGNQIVATVGYQGLTYYYYLYSGNWNTLPDYDTLTPAGAGLVNNVSLSPATRATYFSLSFRGNIRISQPGTYNFYTNSDDGSNLYISNTPVVNNDGLHGATQKSGSYTFSQAGVYPFRVDYYQQGGASVLTASWQASALNIPMSAIPDSVFAEKLPALPGTAPARPTGVSAKANNYHSVAVGWISHSSNQKGFEVYRSQDNGNSWLNMTTTQANITSFTDTTVAPATTYVYKVQAVNQYGSSGFDSITSANTATTPPLPPAPASPNSLVASPVSGTAIFLSWKDTSASATGINIYRSDGTNGAYRLLKQLPGGSTSYVDGSLYPNTTYYYKTAATGTGGTSGYSNEVSAVTTNGISSIYINFNLGGSNAAGGYWNDLNVVDTGYYYGANIHQGDTYSNFKDSLGYTTQVGLRFTSNWHTNTGEPQNTGLTTGNNSGVFPDNVLKSLIWTFNKASGGQTFQIFGLNPDSLYNFMFCGSYSWLPGIVSAYQIGNQVDTLAVSGNTSKVVSINNVKPDSSGTVTVWVYGYNNLNGGYAYGILNGMVIHEVNPLPTNLKGISLNNISGNIKPAVKITWQRGSPNTDSIKVYRSTSRSGSYTLLNPGMANGDSTSYIDSAVSFNTTYYYYLVAANAYGQSASSDTAGISLTAPVSLQMQALSNQQVAAGTGDTVMVHLTGSDSTVQFSLQNAPSFAAIQRVNDSTASVILTPTSGSVGVFDNVQVIAALSNKDTAIQDFNISVTDGGIYARFYLNFTTTGYLVGRPWNNITLSWGSNMVYPLVNNLYQPGSVSLKVVNPWTGVQTNGANTYNNGGAVPDSVMYNGYYISDTNTRTLVLTGLDKTKQYNLVFFGSSNNGGNTNYTTNYTVNGQTVSLNGIRNTNNTVRINGIQPDTSGNITITVSKASGATWGLLNAMIVEAANANTLVAPGNLTATGTTSQVTLNWQDRSTNETGFILLRSGSLNGTYTQVGTVSANTTTYIDNTVVSDRRYFYEVVATNAGGQSVPSNIASVTTPAYAVYVNFNNAETPAPAPWNNTQRPPQPRDAYGPLTDTRGNNSGIVLNMITNFEGENPVGVNTGNNSGIYPDLVMQSCYYQDNGLDTIFMQVSNLDLTKKYDLTFFGSISGWGWINTTQFIANGQTAALETSYNSANTVTLSGLTPGQDGNIMVKIIYTPQSRFAILNALVIKAYDNYDNNGNLIIDPQLYLLNRNGHRLGYGAAVLRNNDRAGSNYKIMKVYPNPFNQYVEVQLNSAKEDQLIFSLVGSNGAVADRQLKAVSTGMNTIRYEPARVVSPGFYVLQVVSAITGKSLHVKLIKQ